jgi:hypothetical protein
MPHQSARSARHVNHSKKVIVRPPFEQEDYPIWPQRSDVLAPVLRVGVGSMSDRAREFLIDWFSSHVQPLPPARRLAEAVQLATKCRADATTAGIPLQEIRDMANGDLILTLLQALDAADRLDKDSPIAPEMKSLIETQTLIDS